MIYTVYVCFVEARAECAAKIYYSREYNTQVRTYNNNMTSASRRICSSATQRRRSFTLLLCTRRALQGFLRKIAYLLLRNIPRTMIHHHLSLSLCVYNIIPYCEILVVSYKNCPFCLFVVCNIGYTRVLVCPCTRLRRGSIRYQCMRSYTCIKRHMSQHGPCV